MGLIDIQQPLAQKVYELLLADTDVNNAVDGRIYDYVPHETAYPYVEIDDVNVENIDSHTAERVDGQVTINVWSRYKGRKEAREVLDKINLVLHNSSECFISNMTTVEFRRSFSNVLKDPDGSTVKGIIRYDFILGG